MVTQTRKMLQELYPDRFNPVGPVGRAPRRTLRRRLLGKALALPDRALRPIGDRIGRFPKRRVLLVALLFLFASQCLILIHYYNKFLIMESDVHAAKSQVDVQLQRRKNIVASLNALVVAYARHEKDIFEHGIDTRTGLLRPQPAGPAGNGQAEKPAPRLPLPGLGADSALSRLLAVAEAFPGLRLSENYQRFMDALVDSETKIAEQRMLLNQRSNSMATAIGTFPALWYNRLLRFRVPMFYIADPDVNEPVRLELASGQGGPAAVQATQPE